MKEKKTFDLSAESVDQISELATALFKEHGTDKREVVRLRLSIEESLLAWAKVLGEDTRCDCVCWTRFGKAYCSLTVPDTRIDPRTQEDSLFSDNDAANNMLEALGLSPSYSYVNGENTIVFSGKRKTSGIVKTLVVPIVLAVILGFFTRFLPPASAAFLSESVLSPLLSAFLRCLTTIAGPLMFLSIVWSIYNIGDMATFGRIGKTLIKYCMLSLLICTAASLLLNIWLYPVTLTGAAVGEGNGVGSIFEMLLDTVPPNIIEPFSSGNIMQIIFLAGGIGLAMLALSKRVSAVGTFVEQSNHIVSLLMSCISTVLPVYVFLSIFNMLCSGIADGLYSSVIVFVEYLVTCLLVGGGLLLICSLKLNRSPVSVFKSVLPTFLIAISTASSTAAYSTNLRNCVDGLGVDEKLANFGVPLGTVIFKAGICVFNIILALFMAKLYSLPITLSFLLTAFLISMILSVAAPLGPGGMLTVFVVLFSQLGIPAEAITLAAALNALIDFPLAAMNVFSVQMLLGIVSKKIDTKAASPISGR